ncbi:unnamed protein product [Peniophora sp. CBMAI 1063]|nr:unnamed protein product [Peniophora sp. CBMAI 1063]
MPVPAPASSNFLAPPPHHTLHKARPANAIKGKSRATSDVFRPNLPLDPFASLPKQPIRIPPEAIFALSVAEPARDVVLALGEPSAAHLDALFRSQHLAFSLLIVASHDPPPIPPNVVPAVRVLRLAQPLDLEHAGAVRLVNVLEWAERVARSWRKRGGIGVRTIDEHDLGALAPPPALRSRASSSASSSSTRRPTMKEKARESASMPTSPHASTVNLHSTSSSASFRMMRKNAERALPPADPTQRPFDALIHCIAPGASDTAMLKQAILVTTVSRPFLVAAAPPMPATMRSQSAPNSRASFLGKRTSGFRGSVHSLYSMPPTPPISSGESLSSLVPAPPPSTRAHLIHLLSAPPPRTAHRVLRSIESFLLNFASPAEAGAHGRPSSMQPARAFLLDAQAFAAPLSLPPDLGLPPDWSVADTLLGGCADGDMSSTIALAPTPAIAAAPSNDVPRAWLLGARDLIVLPAAPSPTVEEPARTHNRIRHQSYGAVEGMGLAESGAPRMPRVLRRTSTPGGPNQVAPGKSAGGLPTPPDSEEEAAGGESPASTAMLSGNGDSSGPLWSSSASAPLPDGREKKRRRWMFWKRAP